MFVLAALDLVLEPTHKERLDRVSRIELGFPHDFLQERAASPSVVDHRA